MNYKINKAPRSLGIQYLCTVGLIVCLFLVAPIFAVDLSDPNVCLVQWKCNEISGTVVADSSGNGRNGVSSVDLSTMTTIGKIGTAFDTYVTYEGSKTFFWGSAWPGTETAAISLAGWFKAEAGTPRIDILEWMTDDGKWGRIEIAETTGLLSLSSWYTYDEELVVPTVNYRDNIFHFVVVTYDSVTNYAQIFVDGSLAIQGYWYHMLPD